MGDSRIFRRAVRVVVSDAQKERKSTTKKRKTRRKIGKTFVIFVSSWLIF